MLHDQLRGIGRRGMAVITDPGPTAAKRTFEAMMEMRKFDIAAIEAARRS